MPIFVTDAERMRGVLMNLNDTRSPILRSETRRLIRIWEDFGRDVKSGHSVKKMFQKHPELRPLIHRGSLGPPMWLALPHPIGSGLDVQVLPRFVDKEIPGVVDGGSTHLAHETLLMLLINPLRESLSHAPCPRCDRYFIKNKTTHKVYCKRDCAGPYSATQSTKATNGKIHELQLDRARRTILDYEDRKRRPLEDWKKWVSARLLEVKVDDELNGKMRTLTLPKITPKFLTRATNEHNGRPAELTPPALLRKGR